MNTISTTIHVHNEVSGSSRVLSVQHDFPETVERLRVAIGPTTYEGDPDGDAVSIYAIADAQTIALHAYGFDVETAMAELNRILAAVRTGKEVLS